MEDNCQNGICVMQITRQHILIADSISYFTKASIYEGETEISNWPTKGSLAKEAGEGRAFLMDIKNH